MDWYLQADDVAAGRDLRHEIVAYLARHAEPGADTADPELIVAELVANAAEHAGGPLWVSLTWGDEHPVLTVCDLGPGFDPGMLATADAVRHDAGEPDGLAEGGRGLFLIRALATSHEASMRSNGGMRVTALLPVTREVSRSLDPPRRSIGALPLLDEARPEGGFGKESFLRALVIQLAHAVELQQGPEAAEAAVAQVGTDVGAQMEDEFRLARGIVGRLSPSEIGQCYVRLKHAIDGGFFVLEATDERVVLGNTRCPFGDVVTQAPSLCRMTSSVFGGIAARNSDEGVTVLLEERIAIGDPGCRVVVRLRPDGAEDRAGAHRYQRTR